MVDLLRTLDMGYLRPHALVGHGNYGPLQSEVRSPFYVVFVR